MEHLTGQTLAARLDRGPLPPAQALDRVVKKGLAKHPDDRWDTALAWTPDAQTLVFVGPRHGVQQIYVRRLDASEAQPLAGTRERKCRQCHRTVSGWLSGQEARSGRFLSPVAQR
jgi:hypothetical protein